MIKVELSSGKTIFLAPEHVAVIGEGDHAGTARVDMLSGDTWYVRSNPADFARMVSEEKWRVRGYDGAKGSRS